MKTKLRDEIKGTAKVRYTRRPALYAQQCAACGKIFQMHGPKSDRYSIPPGTMSGIFDRCAEDKGNMFSATICSFECAGRLYAGGWRDIKEYRAYARANASLERVEVWLTSDIQTEEEVIAAWEQEEHEAPTDASYGLIRVAGYRW